MTTHDAQVERYSELFTEPPKQRVPTTHDLQTAAAQGQPEAARLLERYVQTFIRPAISGNEIRDAVSESLAGTKSNT